MSEPERVWVCPVCGSTGPQGVCQHTMKPGIHLPAERILYVPESSRERLVEAIRRHKRGEPAGAKDHTLYTALDSLTDSGEAE